MKRPFIILIVLAAACRTASLADRNPFSGRPDAVAAGAKLYRAHCAECHGAQASGSATAPALDSPHVTSASDAALFATLTNGRMRHGMPSWSRLPEERRWQIVTYLRSLEHARVAER